MFWGGFWATGGGGTQKFVPLFCAPGGGGKKGAGFLEAWLGFWEGFYVLIVLFCT